MKKLLVYLRPYRLQATLAPCFKLLEAAFELLVPLIMADIIDVGISSGDTAYILKKCLVLVGLGLCGFASAMMLDWRVGLCALAAFAIVYFSTWYVSLSSIAAALAVGISFAVWHFDHTLAVVMCSIMCLLALYMHRENIGRLLKGTERKTNFFKKEKAQ